MSLASRFTLLLGLLVAAPTWSQDLGKASLQGIVRDASTGVPIADAEVRGSSGSGKGIEATTDPLGQFTLEGLDVGEVRIRVFHFFLGGDVTKVVNLTEGPNPKPVEILLRTGGHISGRVTDQEGKPLAGVFVRALRRIYALGKLEYVYAAGGDDTTNSDGQYYIDGLEAGRGYIILAAVDRSRDAKAVSDEPEDPALRKDIPVPTYYPNADSPERALAVHLDSNDTRDHIDIRLLRSPSYCVAGAANFTSLGVAAEETVQFGLSDPEPAFGAARGDLGPDGKFRICDLYPGEYSLFLSSRGRSLTGVIGTASVIVVDRDVDRVTVTPVARSATLTGRVVWEGDAPKLAQGEGFLTLELPAPGRGSRLSWGIPINGEFSVELSPFLTPGQVEDAAIRVSGLPPGAYVKSILKDTLLITLAADGARITAQAADKDGKPVPEAYIAVFPASPASESALALSLLSGKTDSRGAWTSGFLPPGRYSVLATSTPIEPSIDNISFETIEKLWLARGEAQAVDLTPGSIGVVTVVSADLR